MIERVPVIYILILFLASCSGKSSADNKHKCNATLLKVSVPNLDVAKFSFQSLSLSEKDRAFDKFYGGLFEYPYTDKFVCKYQNGTYIYSLGGDVILIDNEKEKLLPQILEETDITKRPASLEDVKIVWRRGDDSVN